MFAAMQLAGYSASESDDLRKAISKKIKDKLLKHKQKFVRGAVKHDIPEETAAAIFADWEEFARYGFNKCLPGDTEIIDATTGKIVTLEDLYHGQAQLTHTISCATDMLRLQTSNVARVMDNGFKAVYRLKTALGHTIEATANHPFYTYEGWKILDHLQVGELIATPRRLPVEGHTAWSEHEVIALGHLLAEGNLCHPSSVYFYSQTEAQVRDFVQAAEAFPNVKCSRGIQKATIWVYAGRKDRKQLPGIVPWAKGLGIWGKNARQKTIPAAVFELNNRQIGLLISRMWEGDGHIDVPGRSLFYATASERMARQLQHLLLRLGIISRLRKVTFNYKEGRPGYQLFITKHRNFLAFAEQIGCYFISQEHKAALEVLLQTGAVPTSTKDVIPMPVKELVRAAKERKGVTWLEMNTVCGVAQRELYPTHTSSKRGFTRETIGRLADYFDDPDLRRYADSDIYWDEIIAIEFSGQKRTYDLEVPGTHNFVANDIIVHNSHAADYGVIAVQTGYLKCHYPEEYMTALLSVTQNDTDKVALYVADCRRMKIAIEPPSVNASGWDFTIEDRPDGTNAIRFGLGAVKNVGHGPVDAILQARGDQPFVDINDFSRRVDLRQVSKRALECLIRVGALDPFGSRTALLASIDPILSISAAHFRASDMGQMSMFGAHTGIQEEITLPKDSLELNRREILEWERELIGLYVSDHPLSPVMDVLTQAVTHFSAQLSETAPGEKVRVAGMVTRVRPHQTKTGKSMGFVTLEDVQGNIDLVVFPRTWEKTWQIFEVDNVVVVDGKVDAQGGEPKVLVDSVTTELKRVASADAPTGGSNSRAPIPTPGDKALPVGTQSTPTPPAAKSPAPDPRRAAGQPPPPEPWGDEAPPDADEFPPEMRAREVVPDGFVLENATLPATMAAVAVVTAEAAPVTVIEAPESLISPIQELGGGDLEPEPSTIDVALEPLPPTEEEVPPAQSEGDLPPMSGELRPPGPPYILPPDEATYVGEDLHMITVVMRPGLDKVRDNLRLRQSYGILISYSGRDRFALQIFERGRGYRIEFPNFTTHLCPELIARLGTIVGSDNVIVEPLTIH